MDFLPGEKRTGESVARPVVGSGIVRRPWARSDPWAFEQGDTCEAIRVMRNHRDDADTQSPAGAGAKSEPKLRASIAPGSAFEIALNWAGFFVGLEVDEERPILIVVMQPAP